MRFLFVGNFSLNKKRARNRANFHCCRLEQHRVIEVWLQIVSADKFGTVMLAHGLEMFLLKQQLMFPVYTIWCMSMPLSSDWSYQFVCGSCVNVQEFSDKLFSLHVAENTRLICGTRVSNFLNYSYYPLFHILL